MKKGISKEEFKVYVHEWANKLEIEIGVISIRQMTSKWASYTAGTNLLIFDVDLLGMDLEVIDYVIVHELLHFRVPNHGTLWKSLMRAHLGDYEKLEEQIKSSSQKIDP